MESSELDSVEAEVNNISKLLDDSPDFREMISSPVLKKEEKFV